MGLEGGHWSRRGSTITGAACTREDEGKASGAIQGRNLGEEDFCQDRKSSKVKA